VDLGLSSSSSCAVAGTDKCFRHRPKPGIDSVAPCTESLLAEAYIPLHGLIATSLPILLEDMVHFILLLSCKYKVKMRT